MVNQPNNNNNNKGTNKSSNNNDKNISIEVPYIQGLGDRFKRTSNSKGMQVQFKGTNTIKTLLMAPKYRNNKIQRRRVIYKFKFPYINCPEEFIGESSRTFGDRLKEHLRASSPSITIVASQDTQSALNVSPFSTGNQRESQETSRRLCTFV